MPFTKKKLSVPLLTPSALPPFVVSLRAGRTRCRGLRSVDLDLGRLFFRCFFRELETYVSSSRAVFGDSGKAFPSAGLSLDSPAPLDPVGAASSVLLESSVQQAPAGHSMGGRGMAVVVAAPNGRRSGGVGGRVGVGAGAGDDEGHLAQVCTWYVTQCW